MTKAVFPGEIKFGNDIFKIKGADAFSAGSRSRIFAWYTTEIEGILKTDEVIVIPQLTPKEDPMVLIQAIWDEASLRANSFATIPVDALITTENQSVSDATWIRATKVDKSGAIIQDGDFLGIQD
jgi:hypothetical protein